MTQSEEKKPLLQKSEAVDTGTLNVVKYGTSNSSSPAARGEKAKEPKLQRQPYHYTTCGEGHRLENADDSEVADYKRYRYYNKLRMYARDTDSALIIPDHVVPEDFYRPVLVGVAPTPEGKQSSIVTIFAIWNTMMGSSLLAMPWAIQQAGFAMGLFIMFFVAAISLYTSYRILTVYEKHSQFKRISEFPELCGILLGQWAEWTATIFSSLAIVGATIAYWVLMSNFLYFTVLFFYEKATESGTVMTNESKTAVSCPRALPNNVTSFSPSANESDSDSTLFHQIWDLNKTTPLFLVIIIVPLVNLKSATFFTKFNSLGTLSVAYLLTYVFLKGLQFGINVDFVHRESSWFIPMFQAGFPSLTGILALAMFIQNAVITLLKNNRYPKNNSRDLTVAYVLVTVTYTVIGVVFYLTFPLSKECVEDNLLNNFFMTDIMTVIARAFLLFQMTTVFPLLMYILRVQLLFTVFGSIYPGFWHVLILNCLIITACVLFAVFLPHIGTIIRFSGALCGFFIIFALPCLLYMSSQRKDRKLTVSSIAFHTVIIVLGFVNFIAQFLIAEH